MGVRISPDPLMPVKKCTENGKPGYKYGDQGKCYTYDKDSEDSRKRAKQKAHEQGAAMEYKWSGQVLGLTDYDGDVTL